MNGLSVPDPSQLERLNVFRSIFTNVLENNDKTAISKGPQAYIFSKSRNYVLHEPAARSGTLGPAGGANAGFGGGGPLGGAAA